MSKAKDHGALLYKMVNLKKMIFPGYNGEIYRILNKKDEVAHYADKADTLEGATPGEILAESRSLLAQHIANKNNPHEETLESIGILSADNILNQLKNKVPLGMSPFDIFGYHTETWDKEDINNKFTISESNVTNTAQEVIVKGVLYTIESSTQNLSAISSSWNNKLWYVFILLEDSVAKFIYSDTYLAEALNRIYVGSIHSGTGAKSLNPVVRLDTFRLSTTPLGSGIAVGLNDFDSDEGIDLGWRPGQNIVRPVRPPKVDIWVAGYTKSSDGTSGYIDTEEYAGEKVLQVNQGVVPNINFGIDGDGVTVTASVKVHSGSTPTVTKVSNTQFRVSGNSYSLSTVTFTAKNQYGDTESVSLHFEIRTNLTIRFGSATNSISTGTQGGLTLATYRTNTDGRVNLALTGDGVTTVLQSRSNTSGSGATVTKVNQTRYDIRGDIDNVMLLTFRATDKYNRTATFSMYVNVRTALPPGMRAFSIINGYPHKGHIDANKGSVMYPRWQPSNGGHTLRYYPEGTTIPQDMGTVNPNAYGQAYVYHTLTHQSDEMSVTYIANPSVISVKGERWNTLYRVRDVPSQRFTGRGLPSGYYCDYTVATHSVTVWTSGYGQGRVNFSLTVRMTNIIGEIKDHVVRGSIYWSYDSYASSCFTPDTLVLMSDGSYKRIDEIQVGESVMTATGPSTVWKVFKPRLGPRKLVSFNGRAKTSSEHSFWGRVNGHEFWCTRDLPQWLEESKTWTGPSLEGGQHIDLTNYTGDYEVATETGWETVRTTEEYGDPSMQLYNLRLTNGGSYFVDGFLVSSRDTVDNDIDWGQFQWKGVVQPDYPRRIIQLKQAMYSSDTWRHYSRHYGLKEEDLIHCPDGLTPLPRTELDRMYSLDPK